ncbi:hypothetical protein [Bacillus sp. TL12]|uniref:hypothetical protein n=1 Tax=Bacillus sp. TL12 TaxID=2894756 RepID=UPI001F526C0A|nr:hypothetical protein [Bacillus sp. TL12]MCI0767455.1 hypothetical protein [Bacillus sp. TL12]
MLLLQMILNVLIGKPHEKQSRIRENIRLLNEEPKFNELIERYGRSILLKFRVRKYISTYDAYELIHNPNKLEQFCKELEKMVSK